MPPLELIDIAQRHTPVPCTSSVCLPQGYHPIRLLVCSVECTQGTRYLVFLENGTLTWRYGHDLVDCTVLQRLLAKHLRHFNRVLRTEVQTRFLNIDVIYRDAIRSLRSASVERNTIVAEFHRRFVCMQAYAYSGQLNNAHNYFMFAFYCLCNCLVGRDPYNRDKDFDDGDGRLHRQFKIRDYMLLCHFALDLQFYLDEIQFDIFGLMLPV